jgi:hypothetical protein
MGVGRDMRASRDARRDRRRRMQQLRSVREPGVGMIDDDQRRQRTVLREQRIAIGRTEDDGRCACRQCFGSITRIGEEGEILRAGFRERSEPADTSGGRSVHGRREAAAGALLDRGCQLRKRQTDRGHAGYLAPLFRARRIFSVMSMRGLK